MGDTGEMEMLTTWVRDDEGEGARQCVWWLAVTWSEIPWPWVVTSTRRFWSRFFSDGQRVQTSWCGLIVVRADAQ